jgi:hypothetical protein
VLAKLNSNFKLLVEVLLLGMESKTKLYVSLMQISTAIKKKIEQRYQSVVNGITERFFREKTTLDFELSFFRIVEINRHQKISVHILILNTFTKISRD